MKRIKFFASMVLASALVVFGLSAPSYACACVFGAPTMTLTTSEVAGRIQVELVDEASQGTSDVVKYYITIYSDEAKTQVVSDANYFEAAGKFLTQELTPDTRYWVEARKGIQDPGSGGWWMSSDSVTASALTGSVSDVAASVTVSTSTSASSLHISIGDDSPDTWYHIEISGSEDFGGMAWQHTTSTKELDVELPELQTFFVRVQQVFWDDVKKVSYPIGLPGVGSAETSASNSNATLNELSVSGFELNEAFNPDVLSYTLTVPTETKEISVLASALNPASTMTLNKNTLEQDNASTPLELSYEGNYVVVDVTSADASASKQYIILVTRLVPVSFYDKPSIEEKSAEASGEVKRTLTGAESGGEEETTVDTPAEPEPTAMPSTGGEESQSGAVTEAAPEVSGDSSGTVWIVSSVAALALIGAGFVLYRRRKA